MNVKKENIGSEEPATKGDLEELREDLQRDTIGSEDRLIAQIRDSEARVLDEFKAVAENIHKDVAGVNADEISLIQNKQDRHEVRIEKLEGIKHFDSD